MDEFKRVADSLEENLLYRLENVEYILNYLLCSINDHKTDVIKFKLEMVKRTDFLTDEVGRLDYRIENLSNGE